MVVRRLITKQLGELLIERNMLTKAQLEEGLKIQREKGGMIGEVLVGLGYIKEEDIIQAVTAQYGFPFLPLLNYEIDPTIIKIIPERVARQYTLIPIDKIANNLTIAMSNPLNQQAIDDIELFTGCTIQTFISTSSDIRSAIDRYYKKK